MGFNKTWNPMDLSPLSLYVGPTLAWHHWFNKAMATPCPLCLSTIRPLVWRNWESCRVWWKGLVTPAPPIPPASWAAPPLQHRTDVQMCRQLLSSANHMGVSCPLKLKAVIVSFPCAGSRLSKTHSAFFWSWLLSQACLKLFSGLTCEVWLALLLIHLLIGPSLGKGSKMWCCTGLDHLSLLY